MGPAPVTTSLRSYLGPDTTLRADWSEGATVFTQHFPDGLAASATPEEDARNTVATCFPCLQPDLTRNLSQLSFGGFMGGWAALTVSGLEETSPVRGGEYGGPLVLFDKQLHNVVIVSSLNNFMVSSMNYTEGRIRLGLMGSIMEIPKNETLEFLVVYANTLKGAFTR